jgi:hypothetical protein
MVVADGEAMVGPARTLLFRIQGVHKSKSSVLLLDTSLRDVAQFDRFLYQTTFVDHDLVFQESPGSYFIVKGQSPKEMEHWQQDWPVGTMDRKLGERGVAFMLCEQELKPNVYSYTNVIYAGAKRRCAMNAESQDRTVWRVALKEGRSAAIIGVLSDGSVAGIVNAKGSKAGELVIWRNDKETDVLPWISPDYSGSVQSATADMSRYAAFATKDSQLCEDFGRFCSDSGRWIVFDRRSQAPLVDRVFPKNGRASLSPDGTHYASFESGELRIYSLPKP